MFNFRELAYDLALKPIFFKFSPENAHEFSKNLLQLADSIPFFFQNLERLATYKSDRLKTKVAGIEFSNPLGIAAGFDKTCELYPYLSRLGFGFIELGTITAKAQEGNAKPRLFRYEKDSALVNRLGFNNPGADSAFQTIQSQIKKIPRGINAGKTKLTPIENTVEDYLYTLSKLSPLCDYAVINISSPNTPGLRGFQEKDSFISLIEGIRNGLGGFPIPTFVKLAPDLENSALEELLDIILSLKLAGIILTNTTIQKTVLKSYSKIEDGGISGFPLRERSNEVLKLSYNRLKGRIPIIGVGGIDSGESALQKIRFGANLIQIYTGYVYKGPFLPYTILEYLDSYMIKQGVKKLEDLVGKF